MNRTDFCLQRLFRAAGRVPIDLPVEAPFSVEAPVLAAWRRGSLDQDRSAFLVPVVHGAFLCACAILLISVAVTLHALREAPSNELVIVDSVIQLTLMQ